MHKKVFFKDSAGLKVCGVLSDKKKSDSVLIMVHGLGTSKESMKYVAMEDSLNKGGIATFRIDLFGHGESDGEFEDLTATKAADDISKAIEFMKFKGYNKVGLLGGSFGGFTSMIAASKSKDLHCLILVSPASTYSLREIVVNGRHLIKRWRDFDYKLHVEGNDRNRKFKYDFFRDFMRYDPFKLAEKINVPVLIIHGSKDDVIPALKSFLLVDNFKDCLLLIVGGASHEYPKEKDLNTIIEMATDFVLQRFK